MYPCFLVPPPPPQHITEGIYLKPTHVHSVATVTAVVFQPIKRLEESPLERRVKEWSECVLVVRGVGEGIFGVFYIHK